MPYIIERLHPSQPPEHIATLPLGDTLAVANIVSDACGRVSQPTIKQLRLDASLSPRVTFPPLRTGYDAVRVTLERS